MFESDVNSALLANRVKRDANTQTTPVEQVPAVEPKPASQQVPVISQPVVPPKEEKVVPPPVVQEVQATVELKRLGSALNLEVKSEEELVTKVTEQLTKLKELESLSLDGIPDQLKQAVEIAKKGGDWLAFAGANSLDAKNIDAVELFERQYEKENAARFKNPDGTIDYAKLDEEIDSISPGMKQMQGQMLKNQIVQRQQQQQNAILAQVAQQQEKFQKNLGEAAKDLASLLPKEVFGITIEPKHSSYFYEGITNGSLIKKHLGAIDPAVLLKLDSKKLMKTLAIAELGENISKHQFSQGKAVGKREVLGVAQNVNLSGPSYVPQPNTTTENTQTSADRLRAMQTNQKPKNSL
jgi:hypothetical protein